jgi:hypothetical protein
VIQSITEDWADGSYTFRLDQNGWIELDQKTDLGPLEIMRRLVAGTWKAGMVREIVRVGLIGGGASPADALRLVRKHVEQRPILESIPLAVRIVECGLYAKPDKEGDAGERTAGPITSGELIPQPSSEAQRP